MLLELHPENARQLSRISQTDVSGSVTKAIKNLHGEVGVAAQLGDIRVKYLNPETGIVFLRARRGPHQLVVSAVEKITKLGQVNATVKIIHTSGTIRSSQKRLLQYHRQQLLKMLGKARTEKDRRAIGAAMDGLTLPDGQSGTAALTEMEE